MKIFIAALAISLISPLAFAQTVVSIKNSDVLVDNSRGPRFKLHAQVEFLNSDLKVSGKGEVSKISDSGQKVLVHLKSGSAEVGMTLEITDHRPDPQVKEDAPTYRKQVALSESDQRILERGEISTARYIIGGVLGTYPLGLGIGHAIQGRYLESGWIFTAGELGSIGLIVIGFSNCLDNTWSNRSCGSNLAINLGVVGLIGFKVWEIIDLWAVPPELNRRYYELQNRISTRVKVRPALLPIANYKTGRTEGAMLGLQLSF